jgi:hypothetical protein
MATPASLPGAANPLSPSTPQPISQRKILLGEGSEEVFFFIALLKHLNIADVQVEHYGGKNNLRNFLATLLRRPGFSNLVSVAVTRDADDDAKAAFQSVNSALDSVSLSKPNASGVFTSGQPRVGVFILPDGQANGMLEDLCLASVIADIAMPCVDQFFLCVENAGRKPNNLSKARTRAWLASQIQPDKRLGEAAQAGYWDFNHPAFDPLKQFLQQL